MVGLHSAEGAEDALHYTLRRVAEALTHLRDVVRAIEPRLSIHAPDVATSIMGVGSRVLVISEAESALDEFARGGTSTAEFRRVADDARMALQEIDAAVEAMRQFVSTEFSFKESF